MKIDWSLEYDLIEAIKNQLRDNIEQDYQEMIKSAGEYCKIRFDWNFMDLQTKQERDVGRTAKHNRFIDNLKIYVRLAKMLNVSLDISELEALLNQDRKEIGDFACYITFRKAVEMR